MKSFLVLLIFICCCKFTFALKPEKGYRITPDSMGVIYKKKLLKTKDGYSINTWMYEPKAEADKKAVLIMSGGDAGNMSYIIYQACMLSQKGFRVITYDYRGFGNSSDFPIDKDFMYYDEFVIDLQTVINDADSNFKDHKIVLYGFSMGSMISGFAASRNSNISLYIAEGYISDPVVLASRIKVELSKPGKNNKDLKLPAHAGEYAAIVKSVQIPFLIFAGTKDNHTTIEDATEAIKQQPRRELIVFDGGHGEAFIKLTSTKQSGDRYFDYISAFADGYLR